MRENFHLQRRVKGTQEMIGISIGTCVGIGVGISIIHVALIYVAKDSLEGVVIHS